MSISKAAKKIKGTGAREIKGTGAYTGVYDEDGSHLTNALGQNLTLTVGGNGSNTTYAGVLSGGGDLHKIGGGKLVLAGQNTYAGGTTITGGTLQLGVDDALPTLSAVNIAATGRSPAVLDLNGHDLALSALYTQNANVGEDAAFRKYWDEATNSSPTASKLTINNAVDYIFDGFFSGNISLDKLGPGKLTVTGGSVNAGDVAVYDGTLEVLGYFVSCPQIVPGYGNPQLLGQVDPLYITTTTSIMRGSQLYTCVGNPDMHPLASLVLATDWRAAVKQNMSGMIHVKETGKTLIFPTQGLANDDPNNPIILKGSDPNKIIGGFEVGTVKELKDAYGDKFDIPVVDGVPLSDDTRLIVMEDKTGMVKNDHDYDDVYWEVTAEEPVDCDIDNDNNGYINTTKNAERMKAEDDMEEQTAKPITYFGTSSPHPEWARYIPLRLNIQADATGITFSFICSNNVSIYKKEGDQYVEIPSNQKYPKSEWLPEYWVKAVGAGGSGADSIQVVLWDNAGEEIARDKVSLCVQDNANNLTGWVIPNDWTISGGTTKTPMPVEGAIGPQIEGTGIPYNQYNKGDAYTKQAVNGAFTLSCSVGLDGRLVQPDTNKDEKETAADKHKLSFVANSGVKIGALVSDPSVPNSDTRYEIAILDVVKWVDMVGGLSALNKAGAWDGDKVVIKDSNGTLLYDSEPLSKLMSCVKYGGSYVNMKDAEGVNATGWEYYYQILTKNYNRFKDRQGSYQLQIQFVPASGNTPSQIAVRENGSDVYQEESPSFGTGETHLSLQSHWGSGVTFSNITIS